jgi:hypothetical protein
LNGDVFNASRFPEVLKIYLEKKEKSHYWTSYKCAHFPIFFPIFSFFKSFSSFQHRKRFQEEIVVWHDEGFGVIAPPVTPAGTITRRAVHKLWMTSANPQVKSYRLPPFKIINFLAKSHWLGHEGYTYFFLPFFGTYLY